MGSGHRIAVPHAGFPSNLRPATAPVIGSRITEHGPHPPCYHQLTPPPKYPAVTVFGRQMARQLKNSCHAISKNSVDPALSVPAAVLPNPANSPCVLRSSAAHPDLLLSTPPRSKKKGKRSRVSPFLMPLPAFFFSLSFFGAGARQRARCQKESADEDREI